MEMQPCRIKACGAKVILARIGEHTVALNPLRATVAVPGEGGGFKLVEGYQPHAYTCVDIAGRHEFIAMLNAADE